MRTIHKMLLLNNGVTTYADYVNAVIAPAVWLRMRETSGSTATNSGSSGSAGNASIANATLGQTGVLGANEAFEYNGTTSIVTIPVHTALNDMSAYTIACLVNPDTAGESSTGQLWNRSGVLGRLNGSLNAIRSYFDPGGGAADTVTTTGLTAGQWAWVFFTFDNAGDRKIHIYKGQGGTVTEYAYSSQVAMTNPIVTPSAIALVVGNIAATTLTFDGLYDEFLYCNRVLSSAEMTQMTALSAV